MAASNSTLQADHLQALCLACGFCCDGTLFECVELTPAEQPLFAAESLFRHQHQVAVSSPCPKHVDRCCSIYGQRPSTCSAFTCKLYDAVASGTVLGQDARARIEQALVLCRAVEQLLDWTPGSFSTARFRQWAAEFPGGEAAARGLHPQAFLKYGLLRVHLNRHFLAEAKTAFKGSNGR